MKPFENLGRDDRSSSGNGHAERRPGDIEEEIEHTRARMQSTIDAIRKDLSPGQIIDQALHSLREGRARDMTSSAFRTVGDVVRDNPLPAAVIGVGVVWLAASQRGASRPTPSLGRERRTFAGEAPGFAPNEPAYESYGEAQFAEQAERPEGAGHEERRLGKERVGRIAHEARARVGDVTHGAAERTRRMASTARDRAQAGAARARDRSVDTFESQPLVVGAIAVGLGALIGALLPSTRREDRVLGARRDDLKKKVDEVGAQMLGRVKEKVDEGAQRVQERLEQRNEHLEQRGERLEQRGERIERRGERIEQGAPGIYGQGALSDSGTQGGWNTPGLYGAQSVPAGQEGNASYAQELNMRYAREGNVPSDIEGIVPGNVEPDVRAQAPVDVEPPGGTRPAAEPAGKEEKKKKDEGEFGGP